MYNTTVIYILGIAIIAYGGVFVVKNFLVNYRASDNGLRNVAVMLLVVMAIILAFGAAGDAWTIDGLQEELQYNTGNNAEVRMMIEREIQAFKRESVICIVSAYMIFTAAFLVYRRIKQEIARNLNKPMERWDWSRIKKNT